MHRRQAEGVIPDLVCNHMANKPAKYTTTLNKDALTGVC